MNVFSIKRLNKFAQEDNSQSTLIIVDLNANCKSSSIQTANNKAAPQTPHMLW